jgi:hypothetical protein
MSGVSEFSAVTSGFGWARAPVFGSGWKWNFTDTALEDRRTADQEKLS